MSSQRFVTFSGCFPKGKTCFLRPKTLKVWKISYPTMSRDPLIPALPSSKKEYVDSTFSIKISTIFNFVHCREVWKKLDMCNFWVSAVDTEWRTKCETEVLWGASSSHGLLIANIINENLCENRRTEQMISLSLWIKTTRIVAKVLYLIWVKSIKTGT